MSPHYSPISQLCTTKFKKNIFTIIQYRHQLFWIIPLYMTLFMNIQTNRLSHRKLSTCVHCAKCQLRLYTVLYNCIWIKMSGSTQLFYFNYDISHLKVSQRLIQQLMSKRRAVNVYLLIIMLSITTSLRQFINDIAHHVSPPPPPPYAQP